MLRFHSNSAYLGGRRKIVKVGALCNDTFGEDSGVALPFEAVANDRSDCDLSMLETIRGAVEGSLLEGNLPVEAGD